MISFSKKFKLSFKSLLCFASSLLKFGFFTNRLVSFDLNHPCLTCSGFSPCSLHDFSNALSSFNIDFSSSFTHARIFLFLPLCAAITVDISHQNERFYKTPYIHEQGYSSGHNHFLLAVKLLSF